ncbi:MAG: FG-GAP-like repeat-containing protein [Cyclobacteriaceae bacterium]
MRIFIQFLGATLLTIASHLSIYAQVTFQKVPIVSMPSTPQELTKGDFNNDGLMDLAGINFNGLANQQVTLLLNSGSGTFSGSNKRNFASRRNTIDVAVGDFNEDGNLDIITVSQENTDAVSLLLGDGAGNLAAPVFFGAGDTPQGIDVGDLNKDGHLDVLVTNRGTPDVYIFLGNGTGGFSAPTIIAITNVWDIAVADFNGDSNPDFAVTVNVPSFSANVDIRFGDGTGTTFAAGPIITGFSGTSDIIAVHLDDDTDIDILAGSGYSLNDGTGNFAARVILTQTENEYTVADINNDTHPDIIANDQNQNRANARIFLGNGAGSFTLLAKFEANVLFRGLEAVDVNGDSFLDIVGVGGNSSPSADILLGDGTGYFPNAITKYPTPADPRDMAKGDFNEDGEIDVALCHSASNIVTIYLGQGGGRFNKTATNHATGSFPSSIKVFDYNSDTHLDLVTLNQSSGSVTVLTGAGDGSFTALGNFNVTAIAGSRMETADFNNDNIPDLTVSGYSNNFVSVMIGTGTGFNAPVTSAVSETISEIKAADFDGDGNIDLAAAFNNINRMVLLTGNGAGLFAESATQYPSAGSFFLVEDINNDSHMDVIAFTNNSLGSDYFINDGAGNFTGTAMPSSLGGFPWAFEDMNGDGLKDLIVGAQNSNSSEAGQVLVFRGTGTGISNSLLIDHDLSGGNRLVVHDVNADGKPDVIATSFNLYEDYLGILINTTGGLPCTGATISSLSANQTVCSGTPVTLTVSTSGTSPITYAWRKDGVSIPSATSSTYVIPSASTSNAGSYSVVVTNACGSETSINSVLTVNNAPTTPIATNGSSCNPGAVTLSASGATDGAFRWYTTSVGGIPISGAVYGNFVTPSLTVTTTYYVSIFQSPCESLRTAVTATIGGAACSNQPPSLSSTSETIAAQGVATIDLNALASDPDNNLDPASFQITVNPVSGAITNITSGILTIDYTGLSFTGTDELTVQVCDLLGSCVLQLITIDVTNSPGELIVYNGISPNGDMSNDTWIIQNIASLPDTRDNKVSIYNRWGDLVFETVNYDNVQRVFKGVNKNGNEVPTGIYFYKIEFNGGRGTLTGYLTVKR